MTSYKETTCDAVTGKIRKLPCILFFSFLFVLASGNLFGATITSTSTGGLSNVNSTWVGNVLPTATDDVVIAPGATVNLGANTTWGSLTVEGTLLMQAKNLTIGDLSGSGTISTSNTSAFTTTTNSNTTFSGTMSGKINLTKNGTFSLTLSGANTYTLETTINAGTLILGNSAALGSAASGDYTVVNSGAVLDLNGTDYSSTEFLRLNGTGISGSGALINSSSTPATYAGKIDIYSASRITADNPIIISGQIASSSPGYTKAGSSTLTVTSANNSWGYPITVDAGTLIVGSTAALGSSASNPVTINSGAVLDLNGFSNAFVRILTLNGTGISGGGALINSSTTAATYSSNITLGSATTITANNEITLSGVINGTHDLTKDGTSTLTLSGLNTYTGTTTINAGILRAVNNTIVASANGALGNNASGLLLNGGTIQSDVATFSRPITVTATNSGLDAYGSYRTISSAINNATASSFNLNVGGTTVSSAEGQNLTLTGVISNSAGTLSLTKIGTSLLTLSAANNFSGGATLNAGQLNINNAEALGSGPFIINGGAIDNTSPGAITLSNNNPQTWNADFTYIGTQPLNMGTGAITFNANRQITVNSGTFTIRGTINQSSYNFTKNGNGTLSFSNQSITLKSLDINAGTLVATSGNLNITGNIFNNGTFTHNNGQLTLNGSTAQTISGSQKLQAYNLVTNNAAGIILNNDVSVSNAHTYTSGIITTSSTNYLIYEAGSSYTGSGDAKHVNGWVKKIGSTNFSFPVGNGTVERKIALNNLTAAGEFNVKYNANTPYSNQMLPPLVAIDSFEYWSISKISGGSASVSMNWDNSKISFPNWALSDIKVASYDGSNWISAGGTASGNQSTGNITSDNVSSFNMITFGLKYIPLPLHLLSFAASKTQDFVTLRWITDNEVNVDRFVVERSNDNIHFYAIEARVARNSGNREIYSFEDHNIINRTAYYRLRSIDIDGKELVSSTVSVKGTAVSNQFKLLTNPVQDALILQSSNQINEKFSYRVRKINGIAIQYGEIITDNQGQMILRINSHLAPGIYILEISNSRQKFFYKFIKQ